MTKKIRFFGYAVYPTKEIAALESRLYLLPPSKRTGKLYFRLGTLFINAGNSRRAAQTFKKALHVARSEGNIILQADILRLWGYLKLHTDRNRSGASNMISQSLRLVKKVVGKDRTQETLRVAANCYAAHGNFLFDGHRFVRARVSYCTALQFARAARCSKRIATVLSDLGNVAIATRQWWKAEEFLRTAELYAVRSNRHALSPVFLRLGILFLKRRDLAQSDDLADTYFNRALETALDGGFRNQEADALGWLGRKKQARRIYQSLRYRR